MIIGEAPRRRPKGTRLGTIADLYAGQPSLVELRRARLARKSAQKSAPPDDGLTGFEQRFADAERKRAEIETLERLANGPAVGTSRTKTPPALARHPDYERLATEIEHTVKMAEQLPPEAELDMRLHLHDVIDAADASANFKHALRALGNRQVIAAAHSDPSAPSQAVREGVNSTHLAGRRARSPMRASQANAGAASAHPRSSDLIERDFEPGTDGRGDVAREDVDHAHRAERARDDTSIGGRVHSANGPDTANVERRNDARPIQRDRGAIVEDLTSRIDEAGNGFAAYHDASLALIGQVASGETTAERATDIYAQLLREAELRNHDKRLLSETLANVIEPGSSDLGRFFDAGSRLAAVVLEPSDDEDSMPLSSTDAALQGIGASALRETDSARRHRARYLKQIQEMSLNLRAQFERAGLAAEEAARLAVARRNQIMEETRERGPAWARNLARRIKETGPDLPELQESKAAKLFGRPFAELRPSEQQSVWMEIVDSAGRDNDDVSSQVRRRSHAGRVLGALSFALAFYEIYLADDKLRATLREALVGGAGVVGGSAGAVVGSFSPAAPGIGTVLGAILLSGAAGAGAEHVFDTYLWPEGE